MNKSIVLISIFLNLLLCSREICAQNTNANIGYNLDYIIGNYGTGSPASTASFGSAAVIDSMGNYAVKQSIANINNQVAYEYALRNSALRAETYFQKRQTNGFYLTLEEWQRAEKARLKKINGSLTREDIIYIYGR